MIAGDLEISLLKKRLEETEKAMERIVAQVMMLAIRMMKVLMVMLMKMMMVMLMKMMIMMLEVMLELVQVMAKKTNVIFSFMKTLVRWEPLLLAWRHTSSHRQWTMLIGRCSCCSASACRVFECCSACLMIM